MAYELHSLHSFIKVIHNVLINAPLVSHFYQVSNCYTTLEDFLSSIKKLFGFMFTGLFVDVDLAVGNQETLSEAYDNGFRDAMVKVLQLLPQSQPESTSQKTVKVGDWAEEIEEKQFTQSTTTDKLSSDDSSATIKSRSAFHVTNEQVSSLTPMIIFAHTSFFLHKRVIYQETRGRCYLLMTQWYIG